MKKGLELSLCILIPLFIGAIAGYYTSTSITTWYVTLNKPSFNPPNYLFGPVWSLLYILMGISLFIVLNKAKDAEKSKIYFAFSIHRATLSVQLKIAAQAHRRENRSE